MIRSRIAPTPSGFLHRGNAANFLLTEMLVRQAGGSLRLRIDDLDSERVRPPYLEDIFTSLAWLGIHPDEGPEGPEAHNAQFSQQLRLADYELLLQRLAASGRVFACSCSRSDVARAAVAGQYAGTCRDRRLDLYAPDVVWRFRTAPAEEVSWTDGLGGAQQTRPHLTVRDFVIRRRDGRAAYHVASLSDDLYYGINLIVRGADLTGSTGAQLLLARALHEPSFTEALFFHHPLILDDAGGKLSKSAGSASLKALREAGIAGNEMRAEARRWFRKWGVF